MEESRKNTCAEAAPAVQEVKTDWAQAACREEYAPSADGGEQSRARQRPLRRMLAGITIVALSGVLIAMVLAVFHGEIRRGIQNEIQTAVADTIPKPEAESPRPVSSELIAQELSQLDTMITGSMQYCGSIGYESGSIPYLDRCSYTMCYTAELTVGIALSGLQTEVTDSRIVLVIPAAELQSVEISPDSVSYQDEKRPLFGSDDPHDLTQELADAQEDTAAHADLEAMTAQLEREAEEAIISLLAPLQGSRQLIIRHA